MGTVTDLLLTGQRPTEVPPPPVQAPLERGRVTNRLLGLPDTDQDDVPAFKQALTPSTDEPDGEGILQSTLDFITGRGKSDDPNLPEIGSQTTGSASTDASIAGGLLITPDKKAQTDIIRSLVPDVEIKEDSKGNTLVRFPNSSQFAFLNKPGVSFQDVIQTVGQVLSFLPGAGIAAKGAQAFGRGTQITAQGGAAFATSAAQDVVAGQLGSEQGIDPVRAAFAAAGGAIGEFASPLMGRLVAALPFRRGLVNTDGTLNARGKGFARAAGIDPDDISPQMARALDKISKRFTRAEITQSLKGLNFADDAQAAIQGAVQQSRFNVPLTVGQRTGNLNQQAREEALRSGALGERGQQILGQFDELQANRLTQAVERDIQRIGRPGALATDDAIEAAGALGTRIRESAADLSERVSEAYRAAGSLDARLSSDSFRDMQTFINRTLQQENVPVGSRVVTPKTLLALNTISRVLDNAQREAALTAVSLKRIEGLRQTINVLLKGEKSGADQVGLLVIKRSIDDFLDNAVNDALFTGDDAALDAIKRARALRTELGRKFQKNNQIVFTDDAGEVIEKIAFSDRTNVEVANWLFGNAKLGQSGRSIRLVDRIEQIFGKKSDEIQLLREGAIRRLLFMNKGAGTDLMGVQGMQRALDEYLFGNGREFATRLHSKEQLRALREFRVLINKIAPKQDPIQKRRLGINPSGSGAAISRSMMEAMQKLATVIGFGFDPVSGAAIAIGGRAARSATSAGAGRAATRTQIPAPRAGVLFSAGVPALVNQQAADIQ